ncbi:unnamed protein product, partial [Rotaria socialis]
HRQVQRFSRNAIIKYNEQMKVILT